MYKQSQRKALVAAIAIAVVLGLAACGSASSSSSSASGGPTSSASGASSSSGSSGGAAAAAVHQMEQQPTTIPAKTALPGKPPSGTFVYLVCSAPQCQAGEQGARAAAAKVGWKYASIPFNETDPSSLGAGLGRALTYHPTAVDVIGAPYALWKQYVPKFAAIHAAIIPQFDGPVPLGPTIPADISGPANDEFNARAISNWVAADSGGKANLLVQSIGSFGAVQEWSADIKKLMPSICPGCKVTVIESSGQEIGSGAAGTAIVSYLRTHPDINYFVGYNGAFFSGLNQGITNAGLKVKVGGLFPLPQNISDVMHGSGGAFVANNNVYSAWLVIDAALRFAMKAPQLPPAESVLPIHLATKSSASASDGNFVGPQGYQQQLLKLWHVG